jgi:glycosyltransferase involved in cell wall biosynthesis
MPLQPIESLSPAAAVSLSPGPLRVLILTADLPPANWSGIGIAVANEARALARLGHAVTLLASGDREISHCGGVTFRPLPRDHFPQDLGRFDRIHLHSLSLAPLGLEVARRWSVPLLYTAHMLVRTELPLATDERNGATVEAWIELQQRVFRAADHVRFLNHIERELAISLCPSLRARSSVLPHGLEPAPEPSVPAAERDPLIVFSGRLCRNKGADIAAHALGLALARLPGWTALIAGGHGDADCTRLVESIAARSAGRICTPGWQPHDELQRAVARAALVVVPSRYEPFGLAALEALRLGAPVLAADTGGLAEILRHDLGVLVPASAEVQEWADAIVALAIDLPLRESLTARGPAAIQQHFNAYTQAEALVRLLPPASSSRAA